MSSSGRRCGRARTAKRGTGDRARPAGPNHLHDRSLGLRDPGGSVAAMRWSPRRSRDIVGNLAVADEVRRAAGRGAGVVSLTSNWIVPRRRPLIVAAHGVLFVV